MSRPAAARRPHPLLRTRLRSMRAVRRTMHRLGVECDAWRLEAHALYLGRFVVPEAMRGLGLGRRLMQAWLQQLPAHITAVHLQAVDLGGGPPDAFWVAMGFRPCYRITSGTPQDHDARHAYVRGVNGHRTPAPTQLP